MSTRVACISIDVDAVRHYHAIHGLPPPSGADPILERGVRRFLELCDRVGVLSTLFVVGEDLDDDAFAATVRRAARAGHEIGSHSRAHHYDLSRRAPAEIEADVVRSKDDIERAVGEPPRGFRAPGYNLSEALLDAVEKAGFAYDSSLLPSAPYWALRAAHVAAQAVRRAPSSSIVGRLRDFAKPPHAAYHPKRGALWLEAEAVSEARELLEIPIATVSLGVPFFGTGVALVPPVGAGVMAALAARRAARSAPCVFELHAIDLCDGDDGFHPALVRARADLRVPVKDKLARFEAVLRVLAQVGDVATLASAAARAR